MTATKDNGAVGALHRPPWIDRTADVATALRDRACLGALARMGKRTAMCSHLIVHRTSLAAHGPDSPRPIADDSLDAVGMATGFATNSLLGTGQLVPYHLLITRGGVAELSLPLASPGAHAGRAYNWRSIAVAVVGTGERCTSEQMISLVLVCIELRRRYPDALLRGHHKRGDVALHLPDDAAPGDATKLCPEPVVVMAELLSALG